MKEAANRGGHSVMRLCLLPFQCDGIWGTRMTAIRSRAFPARYQEPRRCPAFGTGGPFNGIGMGRARLVGGHGSPLFSAGESAIGLSATDACAGTSAVQHYAYVRYRTDVFRNVEYCQLVSR